MISFELSEEQKIAQSMIQDFAKNVLRPAARAADDASAIPEAVLKQIWDCGLIQSQLENNGGGDAQHRDSVLNAIILEELGWADATAAVAASSIMAFVQAIADQGSTRQAQDLLPLFAGDEFRAATIALMEPSFDFDVNSIRTSVTQSADGFRLDGAKSFVPMAESCSHFLVITGGDGGRDAFIVPRDTPGVSVESPTGTLGLRGLGMSNVRFSGVQLGAEARLGEGNGCDVQKIIDSARAGTAAILTGLCRGVYDFVMPYTKERIAHGSALAKKQSVAFRLVDMHIEVEAMRWMSWKAASQLAKGAPSGTRSARLAQIYAAEQASWITDEGVQLLGGHGYVRDNPVELWYRNARTLTLLEAVAGV
jgi:alkylation response protein AidB-like acyl-CoA dehydrogenase